MTSVKRSRRDDGEAESSSSAAAPGPAPAASKSAMIAAAAAAALSFPGSFGGTVPPIAASAGAGRAVPMSSSFSTAPSASASSSSSRSKAPPADLRARLLAYLESLDHGATATECTKALKIKAEVRRPQGWMHGDGLKEGHRDAPIDRVDAGTSERQV